MILIISQMKRNEKIYGVKIWKRSMSGYRKRIHNVYCKYSGKMFFRFLPVEFEGLNLSILGAQSL